jgi:uroporphyrinogen-III decarboxylase
MTRPLATEARVQAAPTEVVAYVKDFLQVCGPGGGYIINSSHSVVPTCQWQNYAVIFWAVRKWGKYPISI